MAIVDDEATKDVSAASHGTVDETRAAKLTVRATFSKA
jgi:hypothetical protein